MFIRLQGLHVVVRKVDAGRNGQPQSLSSPSGLKVAQEALDERERSDFASLVFGLLLNSEAAQCPVVEPEADGLLFQLSSGSVLLECHLDHRELSRNNVERATEPMLTVYLGMLAGSEDLWKLICSLNGWAGRSSRKKFGKIVMGRLVMVGEDRPLLKP